MLSRDWALSGGSQGGWQPGGFLPWEGVGDTRASKKAEAELRWVWQPQQCVCVLFSTLLFLFFFDFNLTPWLVFGFLFIRFAAIYNQVLSCCHGKGHLRIAPCTPTAVKQKERGCIMLLLRFMNIHYSQKKSQSLWERLDSQPANCALWLSGRQAASSFYYFNIVSC